VWSLPILFDAPELMTHAAEVEPAVTAVALSASQIRS